MPLYSYRNPENGEVMELLQSMNDVHEYILEGVRWERIWEKFQVGADTKMDPFSQRQFMDKTDKVGVYGDLFDRAEDASQARAAKNGGIDPIKSKYEADRKVSDAKKKAANMEAKKKAHSTYLEKKKAEKK